MPDDAVYASTCRKLAPHGFECSRHTDDASLLHVMHRSPIDIIFVDVGLDAAMEDRLLLWMDSSLAPQVPQDAMPDSGNSREPLRSRVYSPMPWFAASNSARDTSGSCAPSFMWYVPYWTCPR